MKIYLSSSRLLFPGTRHCAPAPATPHPKAGTVSLVPSTQSRVFPVLPRGSSSLSSQITPRSARPPRVITRGGRTDLVLLYAGPASPFDSHRVGIPLPPSPGDWMPNRVRRPQMGRARCATSSLPSLAGHHAIYSPKPSSVGLGRFRRPSKRQIRGRSPEQLIVSFSTPGT